MLGKILFAVRVWWWRRKTKALLARVIRPQKQRETAKRAGK